MNNDLKPASQYHSDLPPGIVNFLGVPVHLVTEEEAVAQIELFMTESRLHQIATVNPEFVMAAQKDRLFQKILQKADLCLADGIGLVLAGRWLGRPLPERVAGSDMVYEIASSAADGGWSIFLLGAQPGVAEQAAELFQRQFSGLRIAGTYAGSPNSSEDISIVELINKSGADILFVAYGAPAQDKWIDRNRDKLPSVRVAMGIGGSLDFVTGRAQRAPEWIQQLGLEWLHRLLKEPWRWRRMMALPRFVIAIIIRGKRHQ